MITRKRSQFLKYYKAKILIKLNIQEQNEYNEIY